MSVEEIPCCQLQMDKEKPPCGSPMFRIGTAGSDRGVGWAWVCPECDKIPIDNSLDDQLAA